MRAALVLVLVLLAAGCVTTPSAEVDPASVLAVDADGFSPVRFDGFQFLEVDLGEVDGLTLHADVYLPDVPSGVAAPQDRFPAVLMLSPYWGTGTQGSHELGYMPYDFLVDRLVPRGYAVVYGDLAGNGGSGGCWDFMGPVERAASVAMVEAIAAQPWSDGKVAMHGLSYDGMTQIMAASDQAPHLVTVIPAAPLTSAYSGLRMAGVHYGGGWHQTIAGYESSSLTPPVGPFGSNPSRVGGWTETVAASPRCVADNHAGDASGAYSDYYAARDYRPLGADVKASVFYMQGFFDPAVKPDNFGVWFESVPTTKKAWLGFWYHQYPTAENAGRDDMYLAIHRWLDHELLGIENGIDEEPVVDVQDSLGRWRRESAWPPADATPRVLQLSSAGALVEEGAEDGDVAFGGATSVANAVVGGSAGAASFAGDQLAGLHIAGRPALAFTVSSDHPGGVIVARLYDGERMVSQGAVDLRFAADLSTPAIVTPGAPVPVAFELYPTDWVVQDGLRLELLTQDPDLWFDPDVTLSRLTLAAGEEATLTLPTVVRAPDAFFLTSCGLALKDVVDGCWRELEDQGVEEEG